jgi:hypothetical protein
MTNGASNSAAKYSICRHQASDSLSLVCWELPDAPVMKASRKKHYYYYYYYY